MLVQAFKITEYGKETTPVMIEKNKDGFNFIVLRGFKKDIISSLTNDEIKAITFVTAEEAKNKSLGGAVLGGVLLGPVGAIIGGIAGAGGKKKSNLMIIETENEKLIYQITDSVNINGLKMIWKIK